MTRVWWLHPGKLVLFFVVPIYLLIVFLVPRVWPHLIVLNADFYAEGPLVTLGLVLLLGMGLMALVGGQISIDSKQAGSSVAIHPALLVVYGSLTIVAYLIWFYPALARGTLTASRGSLNQMPGVTSFTQLGVPFVVCYLTGRFVGKQHFGRFIQLQFWLILFLTLLRVQLWSERLAMIEVAAPMAVLILSHRPPRTLIGRGIYRVLGALGPFLAIPALLLMFTVTEFFRSWTVYSQTQDLPLLQFMTTRLVTYYFTAINNGAGMLYTQEERWPTFDFFYTAEWLYHLPLGIGRSVQAVAAAKGDAHGEFLLQFADVEFNNMSGIFPIVYDLGYIGGFLYFCVFGLAAGMLYRSMIHGRALGMFFYPPVFVGCLEVMRVTYMNGSRVVLIVFGCTLAYLYVRTARARLIRRELD